MKSFTTSASSLRLSLSLLIGVFLTVSCSDEPETVDRVIDTTPLVRTVSVISETVDRQVSSSGVLAFKREPSLGFPASGRIKNVFVDTGDSFSRGRVLAELDIDQREAELVGAVSVLAKAVVDLERAEALLQSGAISRVTYEDAALAVKTASAEKEALLFQQSEIAKSRIIRADTNGVVLQRLKEKNQSVSNGEPVFIVGDKSSGVVIKTRLSSFEARRVKRGSRVQLSNSGSVGGELSGIIDLISDRVDLETGTVDIRIEPEKEAVKQFRTGEIFGVIFPDASLGSTANSKIPISALTTALGDQASVFVVSAEGVAERRFIRTNGMDGDQVLVAAGLKTGDKVITEGASYVKDGDIVKIVND